MVRSSDGEESHNGEQQQQKQKQASCAVNNEASGKASQVMIAYKNEPID
jgi:hypothetical protein